MDKSDILKIRLENQKLYSNGFKSAAELVKWFGAVQAQDFAGAKWALGQRLGLSDEKIEQEFNEGKILRTHVMRPTWHFVHPQDIKWILKLTTPRVEQAISYYTKMLNLDREFFDKCNKIISNALRGNKFLTRSQLAKALEDNGVSLKGQKLGHVVMQAELDALITSGSRIGKPASTRFHSSARGGQFTYALLDERVRTSNLRPKNPLAELAKRYFQSHGPATIKDFVWWSGLTTADAKIGIENAQLKSETIENKTYYSLHIPNTEYSIPNTLFLLPNYDEYTIAYKDRDAFIDGENSHYFKDQGNAAFWNAIIYKGKVIGAWKKITNKNSATLLIKPFGKFTTEQTKSLNKAAERYVKFTNLPTNISF